MEYKEYVEQASTEVREQMALEGATANEKAIGEFLLVQFEDEGMGLAKAFMDGKHRLSDVWKKVVAKAKKHLHGVDGMVDDQTVFGWACDAILDKEGTKPSGGKKEIKPIQRAAQPKPAAKKPVPKKESNQLSLFDFMDDGKADEDEQRQG